MVKKRKNKSVKINIHFSNRVLYTLIALGIIAILSTGVYAVLGTTPNPGHPVSQLQPCSGTEILKMNGAGAWDCATDVTGSSQWTTSGSNIYYNTGNVGIGTATPGAKLDLADAGTAAGAKFLSIGDDSFLTDIDVANTLGIYSVANPTIGAIKLGSSGPTLTGDASGRLTTSGAISAASFSGSGAGLTNVPETDPTVRSWAKTDSGTISSASLTTGVIYIPGLANAYGLVGPDANKRLVSKQLSQITRSCLIGASSNTCTVGCPAGSFLVGCTGASSTAPAYSRYSGAVPLSNLDCACYRTDTTTSTTCYAICLTGYS